MSGKITDNLGRSSGLVKAVSGGRMGTVDWDTTVKTSNFTAESGKGYFVNTTSGGVTLTLPGSPSAGDIVSVKDYAYTFDTNALTIGVNGSKIGGGGDFNPTFSSEGAFMTFVYIDSTKGWLVTDSSNNVSHATETYLAATGGTIATEGDYKIHTFTSSGTFAVTGGAGPIAVADYLVIAGGGGTNSGIGGSLTAGGGGGGGYRESVPSPAAWTGSPLANPGGALPFTVGCYTVTVGAGGAASPTANGSNSVLSTITSAGGGKSHSTGGSAGGGHHASTSPTSGNTPPVSPPQGNDGGRGYDSAHGSKGFGAGAGGGAGAVGGNADTVCSGCAGDGGAGATSCITASPVQRAGGGGGGAKRGPAAPSYGAGSGGAGGGGAGAVCTTPSGYSGSATNGSANTGGGAGGNGGSPSCSATGSTGGSGVVIIRYRFQE